MAKFSLKNGSQRWFEQPDRRCMLAVIPIIPAAVVDIKKQQISFRLPAQFMLVGRFEELDASGLQLGRVWKMAGWAHLI